MGFVAVIGEPSERGEGEPLHLVGHPLVQAAIADARAATVTPARAVLRAARAPRPRTCAAWPDAGVAWWSPRSTIGASSRSTRVLKTAMLDGDADALDPTPSTAAGAAARACRRRPVDGDAGSIRHLDDAVDDAVFADQATCRRSRSRTSARCSGSSITISTTRCWSSGASATSSTETCHELEKKRDEVVGHAGEQRSTAQARQAAQGRQPPSTGEIEALDDRGRRGIPAVARPAITSGATGRRWPCRFWMCVSRSPGPRSSMLRSFTPPTASGPRVRPARIRTTRRKLARARLDVVGQILDVGRSVTRSMPCCGPATSSTARRREPTGGAGSPRRWPGAQGLDPAGDPAARQPRSAHGRSRCSGTGAPVPRAAAAVGPRRRPRRLRAGDWRARRALRRALPVDGRRRTTWRWRCRRGTPAISGSASAASTAPRSTSPSYQTNFPIAATPTAQRGLDYLAVGDTHGFREIPANATAPTVYPGAPEPTSFGEPAPASGHRVVQAARALGRRFIGSRSRSGRGETRRSRAWPAPRAGRGRLIDTVLRLRFDLAVSAAEEKEVERLVALLKGTSATSGRAGALIVDRRQLRAAAAIDSKSLASCLRRSPLLPRS